MKRWMQILDSALTMLGLLLRLLWSLLLFAASLGLFLCLVWVLVTLR